MVELFVNLIRLYPFVFLALIGFGMVFVTTFWMLNGGLKDEKIASQRAGVGIFSFLGQIIICGSIAIVAAIQNFTGEVALNSKGEAIFSSQSKIWLFYIIWIIVNLILVGVLYTEKKRHPEIFKNS